MRTVYQLLADLIVTIHFAYVSFVVVGLLLTIVGGILRWSWVRNVWYRGIHAMMIGVVVLESWCGIVCPLTTFENKLRELAGQETYSDGFIANALHKVMFFNFAPWVFSLGYTLFGLAVLATFIWIPPRRASAAQTSELPPSEN
ncbi:MAG: DUF2784 domain-containing protein [Planctomycetales bacterium]|nr:DUF2784 domain-containing protein [Planctomycetales bacterium]